MSALKKNSCCGCASDSEGSSHRWSLIGVVLLAMTAGALYWLWPEIQRYIKIKRM